MFQMLDSLKTRLSKHPATPSIQSRAPLMTDTATLDRLEAAFFSAPMS